MSERYYLWVVARLLVAIAIVAWAASYIGPGGGEKEFQKTQEAIKHVRSFRMASSTHTPGDQRIETLWEVDCNSNIAHYRWHVTFADGDPSKEILQDQTFLAGRAYDRKADGTFVPARYSDASQGAKGYCNQIAQGADNAIFPQIDNMIRHGVIQKADKKTINGVRCREWHVTMRAGINRLEHDSVCIGLEDHLPYEVTDESTYSHATYSDYNVPIQIEVPDATVQPVNATTGSNGTSENNVENNQQ
jgi:hypothetical protein